MNIFKILNNFSAAREHLLGPATCSHFCFPRPKHFLLQHRLHDQRLCEGVSGCVQHDHGNHFSGPCRLQVWH